MAKTGFWKWLLTSLPSLPNNIAKVGSICAKRVYKEIVNIDPELEFVLGIVASFWLLLLASSIAFFPPITMPLLLRVLVFLIPFALALIGLHGYYRLEHGDC